MEKSDKGMQIKAVGLNEQSVERKLPQADSINVVLKENKTRRLEQNCGSNSRNASLGMYVPARHAFSPE